MQGSGQKTKVRAVEERKQVPGQPMPPQTSETNGHQSTYNVLIWLVCATRDITQNCAVRSQSMCTLPALMCWRASKIDHRGCGRFLGLPGG